MDIFVFYVCCVGSGLCDELITRSEESCRVCERERDRERNLVTSTMRRPGPELGCRATENERKIYLSYAF